MSVAGRELWRGKAYRMGVGVYLARMGVGASWRAWTLDLSAVAMYNASEVKEVMLARGMTRRPKPAWKMGRYQSVIIGDEIFNGANQEDCWRLIARLTMLVEQAMGQDLQHKYFIIARKADILSPTNGTTSARELAEHFYAAAQATLALGERLVNTLCSDGQHVQIDYMH